MGIKGFILLILTPIVFYILLFISAIIGAWIISTLIASYLALTGILWWCVAIFIFLILIRIFKKLK